MAMILAPGMHPSAGSTVGSHTFPRVKIDPGAQIRCFDPWAIWRFPLLNDFFGSATSFGAFNFGSCFVWRHSLQFDQPLPPCQVLKDSFVGANCRTVRDTQPLRLCSSKKNGCRVPVRNPAGFCTPLKRNIHGIGRIGPICRCFSTLSMGAYF